MRSSTKIILTWLTVMVVCVSSVGASLLLLPKQKPTLVETDGNIIHWSHNMTSNVTREEIWSISFDDFFPSESVSYYVYPKFALSGEYRNVDALGLFTMKVFYYLNDVWIYGMQERILVETEGWMRSHGWDPDPDDIQYFSNATPKGSGNIFEARFTFNLTVLDSGDADVDVVAGPLLLYAERTSSGWIALQQLTTVILVSAILALPATYAINVLSKRTLEEPPRLKRKRGPQNEGLRETQEAEQGDEPENKWILDLTAKPVK